MRKLRILDHRKKSRSDVNLNRATLRRSENDHAGNHAGMTMQLSQYESDTIREVLLAKKGELETRIDTIHDHARNPLDADSAEQAAQLGNVEVTTALEQEAMQEIAEIRTALERLDQGEYGICISCGEEIDRQRLEARPACAECVDCAELD